MDAKEASDWIEAALYEALPSNEDHDSSDILVDWVLVAYVANPDKEKGGAYPMFFSNGNMPDYRAKGLLAYALSSNLGEDE